MKRTRMNRQDNWISVTCAFMVLGVILFSAGCGLVDVMSATAIRGELDARNARAAKQQLNLVKQRLGGLQFDHAVQAYRAENGTNPPSLDALVPKYLPDVPRKADGSPYYYDPVTGTLSETPVAGTIDPADAQMMQEIRNAINHYGTATGYYPATLDALYPNYLTRLPRSTQGEPFIYNNQNGEVRHPRANAPASPSGVPSTAGGSGLVGGVIAGAGIQQSLGNMNTSSAASVRSHSTANIHDITDQQTNRQRQLMNEWGL